MVKRKQTGLLLLTAALLLAGCGEEAVHTSAPAENVRETVEDAEHTEAAESAADADVDVREVAEEGFLAPVEMDETLRTKLTEELLEENEMDTSVVESAPVTKGCSFTLPEAFMESEDIEGMYVTKRYPIDASTIY